MTNDVDTLKAKFPCLYARDGGKNIRLGEIIERVGRALDTEDIGASRESARDIACDVIDKYLLFGAWGWRWASEDALMLRDIRGAIVAAYEAGKAKAQPSEGGETNG
jgi:hypothetical protein